MQICRILCKCTHIQGKSKICQIIDYVVVRNCTSIYHKYKFVQCIVLMQLRNTGNQRYIGNILVCLPSNNRIWCITGQNCNSTQCFSGLCLPNGLERDMISDCPGFALEDELDTDRGVIDLFFLFPMICNNDSANHIM